MEVHFSLTLLERNIAVARSAHDSLHESQALFSHYEKYLFADLADYDSPGHALDAADRSWKKSHPDISPFCRGMGGTTPESEHWTHVLSVRAIQYYQIGDNRFRPLGPDEYEKLRDEVEFRPEVTRRGLNGQLRGRRPLVFLAPTKEFERGMNGSAGTLSKADRARCFLGLLKPMQDCLAAFHIPKSLLAARHRVAPPNFVDAGDHCYFVAWNAPEAENCYGFTWNLEGKEGIREVVADPIEITPEVVIEYLGKVELEVSADPEELADLPHTPWWPVR